jgi:RNA polymerase sigma-70 factor (ECF subfamily)
MSTNEGVSDPVLTWTAAPDVDWDVLFAQQLPHVYNFFRYRIGCSADAEDLTARTFEKAWRNRARYRRDLSGFSTWLLTIARHVAIDYYRARRVDSPVEAADHVAATAPNPEERAWLGEHAARLEALLRELPARERELIALKYGAEMTNRAIAHATGLTETNVGTILQRTVLRLRAAWEKRT